MKTFFSDYHTLPPPLPKPTLSEHSTSNLAAASRSYLVAGSRTSVHGLATDKGEANDQEGEGEEEDHELDSDSENETRDHLHTTNPIGYIVQPQLSLPDSEQQTLELSELMELEMPEDIGIGSPDEYSIHLNLPNSGVIVAPDENNQHLLHEFTDTDLLPLGIHLNFTI